MDVEPNDLIAVASALAAGVAAIFTGSAAFFTRRQSNAVLGNVHPDFSAYQLPFEGYSRAASLCFRITNHNRRAIFLYGLKFDYPDGVVMYPASKDLNSVIKSIIGAVVDGGKSKEFPIPLRINGCGMNAIASTEISNFECQWKNDQAVQGFRLSFKAVYRIDGEERRRSAEGFVDVVAPKLMASDMQAV